MPSLLVQILVTHNLFASVWPSCRESTTIHGEGVLVLIFLLGCFSLFILSHPGSANPTHPLGQTRFPWSISNKTGALCPSETSMSLKTLASDVLAELLHACWEVVRVWHLVMLSNEQDWDTNVWWGVAGTGGGGFSPRQFQSSTCHTFPSGAQLFHDLFQILSISFN